MSGAASPRSDSTGVISSDSAPRRRIVGLSSRRKAGRRSMSFSRSAPRSAVASATWLDSSMKEDTCARSRASGAERRVRVAGEVGQRAVLRREQREDLVGLLERRVGAADDLVELLAAAGQAGAELGDDQRQPLAVGQAHDVVEEVEVDRPSWFARPAAGTGPCPRPCRSSSGRGGAGGADGALLRRRALDELLADQRLRADLAVRVGAEVLEAAVLDVEHHDRLEVAS